MPADKPRPSSDGSNRRGWRRPGKTPGDGGRAGKESRAGWMKAKAPAGSNAGRRFRLQIACWALLLGGLVTFFVYWLTPAPASTPLLLAAVVDYPVPIPPNAWVREDVEGLLGLQAERILAPPPEADQWDDVVWHTGSQGRQRLLDQLDSVKPGGPERDVVIIYISMHGAVDDAETGPPEPCLLPPGASRYDSSQWLRLRDLLAEIKQRIGTPERGEMKVLLVLDCNRMDANFPLGLLYNGFADRLEEVVNEVDVPGLAVLNSTSPGQIGWAAPELQGSVFGYFLRQGLRGVADEDGNDKVSLHELHRYVAGRVKSWVRHHRYDDQEPMLLAGEMDDFDLVHADAESGEQPPPEAAKSRDARWDTVAGLWQQHATLRGRNPRPWRMQPLAWAEFEHKLLRLEQAVQAGEAYRAEFDKLREELTGLTAQLGENPPDEILAAHSLPLAGRLDRLPDEQQRRAVSARWAEFPEEAQPPTDPPPAPAAAPAAAGPENGQPPNGAQPEGEQPPDDGPPSTAADADVAAPPDDPPGESTQTSYAQLAAAETCWRWLTTKTGNVSRDDLYRASRFIREADPASWGELIELRLVQMFAEDLDWPAGTMTTANYVGDALRLRGLAEQAAAPCDPRAFYVIRRLVDAADRDRRLAEDELFVGSETRLTEARRLWSAPTAPGVRYRQALAQSKALAGAFAVRDRALAELPGLTRWLLTRRDAPDAATLDALRAVIDDLGVLEAELDRRLTAGLWPQQPQDQVDRVTHQTNDLKSAPFYGSGKSETAPTDLQDPAHRLAQNLEILETAFFAECQRLEKAAKEQATLQAIGNALAVALLTGSQRAALRSAYLGIIEATDPLTTPEGTVSADDDTAATHLDRLARWPVHPARAWLAAEVTDATADDDSGGALARQQILQRLAQQGAEVRRLLGDVHAEAERLAHQSTEMLASTEEGDISPVSVRYGWSRAERRVRSSAGLLARQVFAQREENPVERLRAYDLHCLLQWHAERAAEDFLGPANEDELPFFETVAEDFLHSAKELCPGDVLLREGVDPASRLLAIRRGLVRNGLRPSAAKDVFIDRSRQNAPTRHQIFVPAEKDLPEGRAAVYLQDAGRTLLPVLSNTAEETADLRRIPLDVDGKGTDYRISYRLADDQRLRNSPQLSAVAYFRGHRWDRDFRVQSASGLTIDYFPPQPVAARLTVYGKRREPKSIILIVDFSGTMGRDGRIEIARRALAGEALDTANGVLGRLVDEGDPRDVGVMLYGHSLGWQKGDPNQVIARNPASPTGYDLRPATPDIHPSGNVEWVLEPGRFTQAEANRVAEKLRSLGPLGVTPLYLAVEKAIAYTTRHPKHIIVVTDGVNDQFGKPAAPASVLRTKQSLETVLRAPGNRDVRLDIVGFGLVASQDWEKQGLAELNELAKLDQVSFSNVPNLGGLEDVLQDLLQLRQYAVYREDGRAPIAGPEELGRSCTIALPEGGRRALVVRVLDSQQSVSATLDLWPGDSAELYLSDDRQRLVHRHYTRAQRGNPQIVPVPESPTPGSPAGRSCRIAAHKAEPQGNGVRFRLSVQDADGERFSPRPTETWVRIQPVPAPDDPQQPAEYVFYDSAYEPDHPVPVLSCLASPWPSNAAHARIEFWGKFRKTDVDRKIPVGRTPQRDIRIDGEPNVRFEIDAKRNLAQSEFCQVTVTERHPPNTDPFTVKVEMFPPPKWTRHLVYRQTGTVQHTFFYDRAKAAELERYQVWLTRRERLLEGAVALDGPLVVGAQED